MKKQKGFGLIGILIIIGALVVTSGGVLVWRKKVLPILTPQTPPIVSPEKPADQCLDLNEEECLANQNCVPVYGPSCPACMNEVFKRCRERQPGEIKKAPWGVVDTLSFSQLWQRRDELLWQRVTVTGILKFGSDCPAVEDPPPGPGDCVTRVYIGEEPNLIQLYENYNPIECRGVYPQDCRGWEQDKEYLITGILSQEKYKFYLEVLSKQKR